MIPCQEEVGEVRESVRSDFFKQFRAGKRTWDAYALPEISYRCYQVFEVSRQRTIPSLVRIVRFTSQERKFRFDKVGQRVRRSLTHLSGDKLCTSE